MLRSLLLKNVYDSAESDIIKELQVPLLKNSIHYRRGVGYFSSGWLRLASAGLLSLIGNGGKAEIILSPNLSAKDWDAIKKGEEARTNIVLSRLLNAAIIDIKNSLENDTTNALAWMIAENLLELKIALPRKSTPLGMYHDKVGVFKDMNGDSVAIHGSLNDSVQGSYNGEAFSVFKSWELGQYEYWATHNDRLDRLWNDNNSQFSAIPLPKVIKEKLINLRTASVAPFRKEQELITHDKISIPYTLEEYQNEAIQKWFEHGRRGIFEMATGTGKTITSLSAAVRVYEEKKRVFLVVIVPYLHLANQWKSTVKIFGFSTILCGSSYMGWKEKLDLGIQNYNLKVTDNLCIIAVSKTASSDRFISSIEKIRKSPIMIIADEVHGLGSLELQKCMQEKYEFRLGLSATPRRWFDDYGTNILFDYFGEPCYEYSLDKAIENGFLVSYLYYPILTNLNNEEHDKYEAISNKIIQLLRVHDTDSSFEETIKKLLIARARILSSAQNKFQMLLELLSEMIKHNNEDGIKTRDILIYCSPGHHKEVLKQVSQLGLTCHEFVADVSSDDRANILKEFENGFYQVLVAIKCLDEGVDVPSTRIAFIMASSTNPREFIQRRGRILRRATNKKSAIIYDFIIVPSKEMVEIKDATEISIIKRELPRFAEFSASASNEFESREKLWNIANKLEILPLLDKKPWEIYADLISSDEGAKYEER